jgi:hypothetical protein
MKKFLFTLAALAMAGTMSAATYFYIPDVELTQDQLNTNVWVDVYLHCEEAFNSYDAAFTYEGDMTHVAGVKKNAAAFILSYVDEFGDDATVDVSGNLMGNSDEFMGFCATAGYWDPDDDGEMDYYGAVKWMPMEEDILFVQIRIKPSADFTGGKITVTSNMSCGQEERPIPTTGASAIYGPVECNITVAGLDPQPLPWEGEIVIGEPTEDGHVAISYTGSEDCTIVVTLNGEVVELVDGQIQLVEGANVIAVTVSAENHDDLVATAEYEWTAPEPPHDQTAEPTYTIVDDPEAQTVTITATGDGHITILWDEQLVAEGEGTAVWVISYGDDPEGEEYGFTVYAQEEGKDKSNPVNGEVFVPGKPVTPPEPPVEEGYQLILVWADGTEHAVDLMLGSNGDYVDVQNLEYPLFQDIACFYFKINGVAYGADEDMTPAFLGEADMNPLSPNSNVYYVDNGYAYTIGIHLITDDNTGEVVGYSAYVAKGGAVEVDELVNGKTVAGVRYFNLAGQEMQEANGMTIVVTTYTDGTTSAVKVMK